MKLLITNLYEEDGHYLVSRSGTEIEVKDTDDEELLQKRIVRELHRQNIWFNKNRGFNYKEI